MNDNEQPEQTNEPCRILIEFPGPGVSDPNVTWSPGVTTGQIRDAAFLLSAIGLRQVFDGMTKMQMKRAQENIVVARGSLPS